jgi:DUF971 family protein
MSKAKPQTLCFPVEVERIKSSKEGGLRISWSDGVETLLSSKTLRTNCPCATCVEERGESNHSAPLSPATGRARLNIAPEVTGNIYSLETVTPVGNYALNLTWQDGHKTGIYSWALLRNLGNLS